MSIASSFNAGIYIPQIIIDREIIIKARSSDVGFLGEEEVAYPVNTMVIRKEVTVCGSLREALAGLLPNAPVGDTFLGQGSEDLAALSERIAALVASGAPSALLLSGTARDALPGAVELQLQAAIKKETSPSNHINYLKEQGYEFRTFYDFVKNGEKGV